MEEASGKISSSSSSISPFKLKKHLRSNSESLLEDRDSLISKTPEKPAEFSTRTRNRKVALSIKEIRRAARSVGESDPPRDLITEGSKSVRRQIDLCSNENQSSGSKICVDNFEKLPEKFEMLCKFFNSLDSALRLSRMKGVSSNFSNLCLKIQELTDRRFSYGHLAQLKFILPEAIVITKVTVFDERTSCTKPELQISFNFGILESQKDKYFQLRKLFRTRISEFVSSHPEIDDVPKDFLPNPFNFRSQDLSPKTDSTSSDKTSIEQPMSPKEGFHFDHHSNENLGFQIIRSTMTRPSKQKESVGLSHFSPSFGRRFSQILVDREVTKTDQAAEPSKQIASCSDAEPNIDITPAKLVSTPARLMASTPAKLVSTPTRLMACTPPIAPPKRSSMSPDVDSGFSTNKLVRRPPRSRSLVFDTPTKEDKNKDEVDGSLYDDILSPSLMQSIREKERKIKEEQSPAITQAKRRQKMIATMPKLFNAIYFLFHKRTVIKREELIDKVIVGNVNIVDKRELDEELNLLFELVPEWISQKSTSNGDVLVCINKLLNAESIRVRLEEAK